MMDDTVSDDSPPLALPPKRHDRPRKSRRSSSDKPSKDRDRDFSSTRELARLLAYEEREAKELQRMLFNVTEQLKGETQRANDAEARAREATLRFKSLIDAGMAAEQETARVNEELRLYKLQLENAQKEIFRAQDVVRLVEAQRHEAEEDAARARSTARKLKEEKMTHIAREEGRQMGMQEGMARGKDIGYEQGRAAGYAQGRAVAERVMDRFFPENEEYSPLDDEGVPYGMPSSGSSSLSDHPQRAPSAPPRPIPGPTRPPSAIDVHPAPARNAAASPRHPDVDIPPDGWIPQVDDDLVIRLPPPHEMARPPPTPSRSPSPPLPPIPADEEPALMIPAPSSTGRTHPVIPPSANIPAQRPTHRRTSSYSSQGSTTISQLDIVTPPNYAALRGFGRRRSRELSVIPEASSAQASPNPRSSRRGTPIPEPQPSLGEHSAPYSPQRMTIPTPRTNTDISGLEQRARDDYYRRRHESSDSSDDAHAHAHAHRSPAPPPAGTKKTRRGSSSTIASVPEITIQPPSRSPSNGSRTSQGPRSNFLSPADADRPIPLPNRPASRAEDTPSVPPAPPQSIGGITPIILPSGQLPPGFVPSGPPTALGTGAGVPSTNPSTTQRLSPLIGGSAGTPSVGVVSIPMPGGFPDHPSPIVPGTAVRNGPLAPSSPNSGYPGDAVVIPPPSMMSDARNHMYDNSNSMTDSDDDEAGSSGISSSVLTLTTPPTRARRVSALYAPPPHTTKHATTPHSDSSAAAVPLPPSTFGGSSRGLSTPARSVSKHSHSLRNRGSGGSLRSQGSSTGSHKKFDREAYLDPAFLASSDELKVGP